MYFEKVINRAEQDELIKRISSATLNFEGNDPHYTNSYGTTFFPYDAAKKDLGYSGVDPFYKNLFDRMTVYMEAFYQTKLMPSGLYVRIYRNGAILKAHRDQPHLQYTSSLCVLAPDVMWPLYVENKNGPMPIPIDIKESDMAAMNGTELNHWRDPLVTADTDMGMYIFFHWKTDANFILDDTRILDGGTNFYIKEGFISDEVADEMNALVSQCRLVDSMVREDKMDRVNLAVRSNKTTDRSSHPQALNNFIAEVDRRLLNMIGGVSPGRLEGMAILRYYKGQYFVAHMDCNHTPENDREFTYLLFLSNVEKGGETKLIGYNQIIQPKKGTLVAWRNMVNGQCDQRSLHEGAPIIKGEKTVLVNWIFQRDK